MEKLLGGISLAQVNMEQIGLLDMGVDEIERFAQMVNDLLVENDIVLEDDMFGNFNSVHRIADHIATQTDAEAFGSKLLRVVTEFWETINEPHNEDDDCEPDDGYIGCGFDGEALASAGFGTDEDYGGGCDDW